VTTPVGSLTERHPTPSTARLLNELVPPRHFASSTFESYRPDPSHYSQSIALEVVQGFARALPARRPIGWAARRRSLGAARGGYLDGGFGVGKTHLLAALAHAAGPADAAYGTFAGYTHLVGALGLAATLEALAAKRVVCIGEFELDDPGDTVLMARLLRELTDRGVALAATSNTLPESLGEGRFAAEEFLREIQSLAARFEVVRVDGPDYRHRDPSERAPSFPDSEARERGARIQAMCDDFTALLAHLATIHPSRYGALLDGVPAVALSGVGAVPDQSAALTS